MNKQKQQKTRTKKKKQTKTKTEKSHNLRKSLIHAVVAYQMQSSNILENILCDLFYSPLVFIESLCNDNCICCVSMIYTTLKIKFN